MMRLLDDHLGFVWDAKGEDIIIQLRIGGKLRAKNNGGFDTGDRVAIIFDTAGKVVEVVPQEMAKRAVRIGSDPVFADVIHARFVETHIFDMEEDNYGYTSTDHDVIGVC